eukprot:gb/GECH01004675.1/.p1 GENE.gb/GECH01004675.1/~~gb/GECH01004675.1/.p1  ORF type:complete len:512 (+),score=132.90 gb/GECH01004675.1/:1-1536(+)
MLSSILFAIFLGIIGYIYIKSAQKKLPKNHPPVVPYQIPWIGSGKEFSKSSFQFFKENTKKYGPIFSFYMAGNWWTYLGDRNAYDIFFKARDSELRLMSKSFEQALGPKIWGLLWDASKAPEHIRKEMQWGAKWQGHFARCLSTLHSESFAPIIQETTQKALNDLPNSSKVDLFGLLQKLVVDLSGRLVLGKEVERYEDFRQVWEDFEYTIHSQANLIQSYALALPLPASRRRKQAIHRLIAIISEILDHSKNDENRNKYDNMMNSILETAKIDGKWIGSEAMAPLVITLILAATFNVAASVFWTIYYLKTNPKHLEKVQKEIREQIPEFGQDRKQLPQNLDTKTLDAMPHLYRSIKEAIRLNSSTMLVRQMVKPSMHVEFDTENEMKNENENEQRSLSNQHYGPYEIPFGRVCLSPQVNNMDPEIYPQPEDFNPDRFIDFEEKKHYYLSFGGGIHKCKGEHLAYVQVQTMVITILNALGDDWELIDDQPPEPNTKLFGVLKPKDPVMIKY